MFFGLAHDASDREPYSIRNLIENNMISDEEFLFLNAIYLKKMAGAEDIAVICDLPLDRIVDYGVCFVDKEMLLEVPDGYLLLTDGTKAVLEYYHSEYKSIRNDKSFSWYERFEKVNSKFIKYVTDWQSTNDNRDLEKLFNQVDRLIRLLGDFDDKICRYRQYIKRFEKSMSLVDRGDYQYVCNPTVDSVHNIWFEFHEDILAVIDRPRDTT